MNKHILNTLTIGVKQAYRGIVSRKLRSALTLAGIMIGSAAVVIVVSAGGALKSYLMGQLAVFGSDFIEVEVKVPVAKKASLANAVGLASGISVTTLTDKDLESVKHVQNIKDGYVGMMDQELVNAGAQIKKINLYGVSEGMISVERTELSDGRFFTADENTTLAPVVIVGSKVKETLFGEADALNQIVRIRGKTFRVIGLMAPRGSVGFFDFDSLIYIPVRTLQKSLLGVDNVTFFTVNVRDIKQIDATADEIAALLRVRHHISDPSKDDFAITTEADAQKTLNTVVGGITLLLLALVSIAFVVGGVGIMNVMYVSVAERTFEIGLRKAVGAEESDILYQFLFEAIALTGAGGVAGAACGAFASYVFGIIAASRGFAWSVSFPYGGFALACGFAVVVGVVFGLYPARRAARLEPVEALRSE